jgi:uncharacterized membrane protein YphA (DoxX/SURF4 family)
LVRPPWHGEQARETRTERRQRPVQFADRTRLANDRIVGLLVLGCAIGVRAWQRESSQRDARAIGIWLLRTVMGVMWWQQSLWKIPPNYGGLLFWMKQMVAHAAIPLQASLVKRVMIPNIAISGPLVYAVEVLIGVSLLLDVLTRIASLLGLLMAVNLWFGLYSAPNEWPWTYGYLIVIQALFLIDPPGRSLGLEKPPASR